MNYAVQKLRLVRMVGYH